MTHSTNKRHAKIKNVLEQLYTKYNHRRVIKPDPLQFVYQYSRKADMEIAALLSSALAYGRVEQIEKSLIKLFALMGTSPYEFVKNFGRPERKKLRLFKHRFTSGSHISDLLEILKKVLEATTSIEDFFLRGYNETDKNIIPALTNFCTALLNIYTVEHKAPADRGLRFLLANPANASPCKRLNLFLRWMVRSDEVDPGLWNSIDKAKLIVPIDIHMSRLCKILGLYDRETISLAVALEITESFAKIVPDDPVKYDFALSRIGIIDNCTGKYREKCEMCELFEFCFDAENKQK